MEERNRVVLCVEDEIYEPRELSRTSSHHSSLEGIHKWNCQWHVTSVAICDYRETKKCQGGGTVEQSKELKERYREN